MFLFLFLFQGTVLISLGYFCTHAIAQPHRKKYLSLGSTDPIVLSIVTHLNSTARAEACHRQSSARAAKCEVSAAALACVPCRLLLDVRGRGAVVDLARHKGKGALWWRCHTHEVRGGAISPQGPVTTVHSVVTPATAGQDVDPQN